MHRFPREVGTLVWKIVVGVVLIATATGLYVGFAMSNTQIRTIHDVRTSNTAGGTVVIHGKVTYASDNLFVIDDGTGRAELSTCPSWYKRISLFTGDDVMVIGEVMVNPPVNTQTDFTLSAYKIIQHGRTIEVRGRPGKPPWTSCPAPTL